MPKIDKVSWGKVKIDGKNHSQVLIIGDQVYERDSEKLHQLFRTSHEIADWEQKLLLSKNPEVILIATGWNGVLKVNEKFKNQILKLGIELRAVLTPKAIDEYNRLVDEGKKVNALIHTTC